jgi:Cys-rich protein (TIGR01571 family)
MVKVQSPADLEEGYQFDAVIDGQTITVTVPPGGVKEGQVFEAPEAPPPLAVSIATTGMWKNDLCGCFENCGSGSFWMGWCCFPILLGQVMQRMNLSCIGTPTSDASKTCKIITGFYAVVYILLFVLNLYMRARLQLSYTGQGSQGQGGLYWFSIISNCLLLFFLIMHMCVRNFMRKKYKIRADCCGAVGDCCIPMFCSCCSVIQLHRHTHDEDQYPYNCGTATGLSLGAPAIV